MKWRDVSAGYRRAESVPNRVQLEYSFTCPAQAGMDRSGGKLVYMEESGSVILAVCGIAGLVFGLGAFVWYGMFRGFTRTAIATAISSLMGGDTDDDGANEDEPFDPETAPDRLSDIMVEQADSLDFAESVEKHRTQEIPAVRASSALDENIANRMAKRLREFSPISRAAQVVSRPFRFMHLRLRSDETEVEVSPPLREDYEPDYDDYDDHDDD